MTPAEILAILEAEAPDVEWTVGGDYVKEITGVGAVFEGLNVVKRQQYVYGILNSVITDGSLHAVSIKTMTPAEQAGS